VIAEPLTRPLEPLIRPLEPRDRPALEFACHRLSAESRWMRFSAAARSSPLVTGSWSFGSSPEPG
jgi:hypothetical protein